MRAVFATACALAALGLPTRAAAHDFSPGVLALAEIEPGTYRYRWTPPVDAATALRVTVRFPAHCERSVGRVACGADGLHGDIALDGMRDPRVRVVVTVERLDGRRSESVVHGGDPRLPFDRTRGSSALAWLRVGGEHVLFGFDHLAFLLGLLLVAGLDRRIVATVTGFTLAHSLTLALATFGLLRLSSAPVEATIAASVVLVARESTHRDPTLTRRRPWIVASLFGLVHGLGFAGALSEIGLPQGAVGWALLWFNLGVEVAQLAVVALVALLVIVLGRRAGVPLSRLRAPAGYAIGGLGAWWTVDRTLAMLTGWW